MVNNGIPANPNLHPVPTQEHAKAQLCDAERKENSKLYVDIKRHAKETHIKVWDIALLKQPKENKLSTRFNPKPYKVVAMTGHMVTGTRGDHQVTRHASFFSRAFNVREKRSVYSRRIFSSDSNKPQRVK